MADGTKDVITHLVMGALIIVLFGYIVVEKTDPTSFFMRHYAQDTGLITEALHGANGAVNVRYLSIYPDHLYWFKFTAYDVLIGPAQLSEDLFFARMRKQYGALNVVPSFSVKNATLRSPTYIDFAKNSREITVDGNYTQCAFARKSINKKEVALIIDAPLAVKERLLDIPNTNSLLWDGDVSILSEEDVNSFRDGIVTSSLEKLLIEKSIDLKKVTSFLKIENKDARVFLLVQEFEENPKTLLQLTIKEADLSLHHSLQAKGASCLLALELSTTFPTIVAQQTFSSDIMEIELTLPQLREAESLSLARATSLMLEGLLR